MDIKDLAGLSEPLTRLIEVISSGIGNVSKSYLTKKNADAKAYEIKAITQAIAESQKLLINSEYEDGKIKVIAREAPPNVIPELSNRATTRLEYQDLRQQQNIEAVCANAAEELAQENSVPENKPEPEWISRFIDISSGISTEELQNIWGRILAGEIKRPGSFSLRTLDILSNLSRKEAENFVKLGNYIIKSESNYFFIDPQNYIFTIDDGLKFVDILELKDAGLIFQTDLSFSFSATTSGITTNLLYGPLILLFERDKDTPILASNVGFLTKVGVELLQLITIKPDIKYANFVGKCFHADGIKLSHAPIIKTTNDQIEYGVKTYIEPNVV